MRTAIFPGSFDPVTLGHIDMIERASKMVDRLVVGVLCNNWKSPLFSAEERVNMIKEAVKHLDNVEVTSFDGMLVDFADACGARIIVRGLRTPADFEYESHWAQTNRIIRPHLDTLFLVTSVEYTNISSSAVREIAKYGEDVSAFVPPCVIEKLREKNQAKGE